MLVLYLHVVESVTQMLSALNDVMEWFRPMLHPHSRVQMLVCVTLRPMKNTMVFMSCGTTMAWLAKTNYVAT